MILFSDINECEKEDICRSDMKCNNIPGTYYCDCKDGFERMGEECVDKEISKLFVCLFFKHPSPRGNSARQLEELHYAKLDKPVNKHDLTSRLVSHRIGGLVDETNLYLLLGL